ncbi:hypothetical protein NP233_g13074 [Leucocoprinus birnbaumii]|uniref:F-box only protein 9 n=1 Tax=Leucocoprinus birnbaumii TaxID=56174 RepID=A0AAD5YPD7_9AGAR|nr:hypothetical protein NP233_g13074 [Leucocoprinus birnbaumii]
MTSASAKGKAVPLQEDESTELARFRAEWKAELAARRQAQKAEKVQGTPSATTLGDSGTTTSPGPSTSTGTKQTGLPFDYPIVRPHKQVKAAPLDGELHPAITSDGKVVEQKQGKALKNALSIYKQAVRHEQDGELDDALSLYRQAFRMDAHVDRAYRREEMLHTIATQQAWRTAPPPTVTASMPAAAPMTQPLVTERQIDDVTASIQTISIKPQVRTTGQAVVTGDFGTLIAKFLEQEPNLIFKPEDEVHPVTINMLPEEILVEIIHMLDPSSIETFAQVCKKARVLTLETSIWRRVFIKQPRVRMDGVYIAICHYVRPGLSENHWVNISHLITYHRYLRFYPNGQVLSLLANEEHPPQSIINMLKPSLRMKGLYIGTWSLTGTEIALSNLFDASGRYPIPGLDDEPDLTSHPPSHHHHHHGHHHHSHSHGGGETSPSRYVFVMSLGLKSRPLGRWNRLDIHSYDTLNLETGDLTPVALKHERPFWFSKVKSYAT